MNEPHCHKHNITPKDESWQVAFQELVAGDDHIEPFVEQVCPVCYIALREKNRKNKRQLKVESLKAVRLQAEVGQLQRVIEAVAQTIKEETGQDAMKLVGKAFPSPCNLGVPGRVNPDEVGTLERILPNLIVEAIAKARKSQNP